MSVQAIPIDSSWRRIISWLVYPLGLLLPIALIVAAIDPNDSTKMLPFVFLSYPVVALLEWIHPHTPEWHKNHGDLRTDVVHLFVSLPLSLLARAGVVIVFFSLITRTSESFALITWPSAWPLWIQFVLGLVVAEFGSYWSHRLFHEWTPAWHIHAVHHSAKRLYFLNAARFHFLDLAAGGIAAAVMLSLAGAPEIVVILIGIFTGMHGNWQHGNVRQHLGPLNHVIAGAELHRWHHASDERHTNSNYGNNLIVWDKVFGTYCLPERQQDVDDLGLGEDDARFPQGWWKQLFAPFRWKSIVG